MKMIVTGAAGFIGSHLSERLVEQGHDVTGIDCFLDYYPKHIKEANLEKLIQSKRFTFLEQDLLEVSWPKYLNGAHTFFHVAAQAGVSASWGKNFVIYTKNNIDTTQKILEESKGFELNRFVFASTSSVYGDTDEIPMRETAMLKPISPYGVTKLAAEGLCYLYWKNFGVPAVCLRYFTVYGPRQRPDMAFYKFLLAALEDRTITIFEDGNQTRDFTYIDDIVEGTIAAGLKGKPGVIYNLGGGSRTSVNEVIQTLQEITGKPISFRFGEKQKGDMRDTFASTERAYAELGYRPAVSLKEGLLREYEWLQGLRTRNLTYRVDTQE